MDPTASFQRESINGIRVHVLPTDRFKTFAISLNIGIPLAEEDVTKTALIPYVLRRGTERFPETKAFREKLDEMFGAGFGFDIHKRGDYQLVQFRMDVINDDFVAGDHHMLEQALTFLGEAVTRPALENGVFVTKYVEAEKNTIKKRLESIINDKIRYAAERCMEEMFAHEAYRLNPLGKISDLPHIDAEGLYRHYNGWLKDAGMDLYIVGNTSMDQVSKLVKAGFDVGRSTESNQNYGISASRKSVESIRTVVEKLDVQQGKLNMGLRTNLTFADPGYAHALMYNGILGSYPHSKLFINVREKASLAYYASSRMDAHKGIMTIQSGIEFANVEKAIEIMKQQLEEMRQGNISETEMNQTRAMMSNSLKEIKDSAFDMIAFDFNNQLASTERSVQQLLEELEQVTTENIRQFAEQVQLDTIYVLRDRKED